MVDAISREIALRKTYLLGQVETIYFGGGTPSLLSVEQLEVLMDSIQKNFHLSENPEITLEANPEDLTLLKAQRFLEKGINRLSIGIQTFHDEKLVWMNRAHH